MPLRLREHFDARGQIFDIGRFPVVRLLTRAAQVRAEALPGLRDCGQNPP
jgi:hypothetical protein